MQGFLSSTPTHMIFSIPFFNSEPRKKNLTGSNIFRIQDKTIPQNHSSPENTFAFSCRSRWLDKQMTILYGIRQAQPRFFFTTNYEVNFLKDMLKFLNTLFYKIKFSEFFQNEIRIRVFCHLVLQTFQQLVWFSDISFTQWFLCW